MKTWKAFYTDDDALVAGVLVKRFLRKPVFLASDTRCGWEKQVINKKERGNIIQMYGVNKIGKSKNFSSNRSKNTGEIK